MTTEMNAEDKDESEAEKLPKSATQLLEDFRALDAEVTISIKEVDTHFKQIVSQVNTGVEEVKSMNAEISKNLTTLSREIAVLATIPQKLQHNLNELIPQIASQIQKECFKEYDVALAKSTELINGLNSKLELATRKLSSLDDNKIKTKIKSSILLISISLLLTSAITFGMFRFLPRTVTIDTKGDISIDGSDVSIWGMGKNTVSPSKNNR